MNILQSFRAIFFAVFFACTPGTSVAQDEAVGIFAGAKALYAIAQTKTKEEKLDDYRGVRRLLDLIVEEYPSSDLAVSILLQDTIEGVDVAAVDAALEAASPDSTGLEATSSPDTIGSSSSPVPITENSATAIPSPNTSETIPELVELARTEKEIVLDVQAELNRIGCSAGTADGVAGRRTKSAFSDFIKESGVALSDDDLPTEEAVVGIESAGRNYLQKADDGVNFGIGLGGKLGVSERLSGIRQSCYPEYRQHELGLSGQQHPPRARPKQTGKYRISSHTVSGGTHSGNNHSVRLRDASWKPYKVDIKHDHLRDRL